MMGWASTLFLMLFAGLLVTAAVGDWRSRIIPNRLVAAVALAAIPYWLASGIDLWPDGAIRLGLALLLFALFAVAFALGAMGGGDVKLIAAVALWLPPASLAPWLMLMAVTGGALTLALYAWHRLRARRERLAIPYGIAISFAALWLISEPILNHFA